MQNKIHTNCLWYSACRMTRSSLVYLLLSLLKDMSVISFVVSCLFMWPTFRKNLLPPSLLFYAWKLRQEVSSERWYLRLRHISEGLNNVPDFSFVLVAVADHVRERRALFSLFNSGTYDNVYFSTGLFILFTLIPVITGDFRHDLMSDEVLTTAVAPTLLMEVTKYWFPCVLCE